MKKRLARRASLRLGSAVLATLMAFTCSLAAEFPSPKRAPPEQLDGVIGNLLNRLGQDAQSRKQRSESLSQRGLGASAQPAEKFEAEALRKRASASRAHDDKANVAGLLVRFRSAEAKSASEANQPPDQALISAVQVASGVPIVYSRPMSMGYFVFQFPLAVSTAEAREILNRVAHLSQVEAVDMNVLMEPSFIPNDPLDLQSQHSLRPVSIYSGGIDAYGAWDFTTGSQNTIVAVLDTGITAHPEFNGRILQGADFISNSNYSNDGDGRDLDPSDPGDWNPASTATSNCPAKNSGWHGTHVTGTIAANSNNGIGISGVDWRARIVPVRVLGRCGGVEADIIDAIQWAAGFSIPGLPNNPNPVRILNISIGGSVSGGCSKTLQAAIQKVKAKPGGTLIVVAAGNESAEVVNQIPASCKGIVSVGAVDPYGELASYSNYSSQDKVNVSAPGGDSNRYGALGGILSTMNAGITFPTQATYNMKSGTSMAAPHVTGIASLALSVNPNLNSSQLEALLQLTAAGFPASSLCNILFPICGAGIANAKNMVQAASAFRPYKIVSEFYNADTGHFFRTGDRDEPEYVESGRLGNWTNTGDYFLGWSDASSGAKPVCRFYSYKFNSHFYTANKAECDYVKGNSDWVFENIAFYAKTPTGGICPPNSLPIYRFYNNRHDFGDGNHMFTRYHDYYAPDFLAAGWRDEGVVMCSPEL